MATNLLRTIGIGCAVLVPALAVAALDDLAVFSDGDTVSASAMNANFAELVEAAEALQQQVTSLEARTPQAGTRVISGGAFGTARLPISNGGYTYVGTSSGDTIGLLIGTQVPVQLPIGAELRQLRCYFYNNSSLEAVDGRQWSTSLRRIDTGDSPSTVATAVGEVATWPDASTTPQVAAVTLEGTVRPNEGYFLHAAVNLQGADLDDAYPPALTGEARRQIRHHGCQIDFEFPE